MDIFLDVLSERTEMVENVVNMLRQTFQKIDCEQRNLDLIKGSRVDRMLVEQVREPIEKVPNGLEGRQKKFETSKEGEKRKLELELEREELSIKRPKFMNRSKLKDEKLNKQLVFGNDHGEGSKVAPSKAFARAAQWRTRNKSKKMKIWSIKSRQELLAEKERKVRLIIDTLDARINVVEGREKALELFLEKEMREIMVKEEQMSVKWQECVKEVKVAEEKFSEKQKSVEKQLQELEKEKTEFNSFQEAKNRELDTKEKQLNDMYERVIKDIKLEDEKLREKEKEGCQFLTRLKQAQDTYENLKQEICGRLKEIKSATDWVESKMDEADCRGKELDGKEKTIKKKQESLISKENNLEGKEQMIKKKEKSLISKEIEIQKTKDDLVLKEKNLKSWQKELEVKQSEFGSKQALNEQQLEELNRREKSFNSMQEFSRNFFKEFIGKKKKLRLEKDLVEKCARELQVKEQQLECTMREFEFEKLEIRNYVRELELKKQVLTDTLKAKMKTEPDDSVDVQLIMTMNGKTLQTYLNDPKKDLETMNGEILEFLHLSSDPAKLVLDAMAGFYPPHLREEDVDFNVRRTCIMLLKKLIEMSVKVQPYVKVEALDLASEWKSKMSVAAEKPLEVIGFLLLLAAYDITSFFEKDEILSLLRTVSQHMPTPDMCRNLGFEDIISTAENI